MTPNQMALTYISTKQSNQIRIANSSLHTTLQNTKQTWKSPRRRNTKANAQLTAEQIISAKIDKYEKKIK